MSDSTKINFYTSGGLSTINKWICVLFVAFGVLPMVGAQTIITEECDCLAFPSIPNTGQFVETIRFNGPTGTAYTLTDFVNFYDIASPAPPAAPTDYPDNIMVPEVSPGVYEIQGIRIEGWPWSVTLNYPSLAGLASMPIASQYLCSYPDTLIYGDTNNCIGTSDFYWVDLDDEDIVSIQWTLSGGGVILSSDIMNNVEILWGSTPGTYQLSVDVTGVDGGDPDGTPCTYTSTINVEIVDEGSSYLACNNDLNLSISGSCNLQVTPETFLETLPFPPSSYDVILIDPVTDTIIPGNMISQAYIGKKIQVKVRHECSLNSCWGYITLEDKSAPALTCLPDTVLDCEDAIDPQELGYPLPPGSKVIPIDQKTYEVIGMDDCGDAILSYSDEVIEGACSGPYSAIITRTWIIEDKQGNTGSCSFDISVNTSDFSDIVFPENYDDEIGTQPSLEACSGWAMDVNGAPSPSVTGEPSGAICLNVHVEYEDLILYKCSEDNIDNTFKVLRRWWVSENCPGGRDSMHTQIISVMDYKNPIVKVPAYYDVMTNSEECATAIEVPVPMVEECSVWDYAITYQLKDSIGFPTGIPMIDNIYRHSNGQYIITDIPGDAGEIWISYTVVDACGNQSTATTEVRIIDTEEPIPVCDEFSFVSLNEMGEALAGVFTFDDGSWDNCGIDYMEVRRMDPIACGVRSDWGKKVKFCCADVGRKDIMVSLRVVDFSGNSNTCMVNVEVQDNEYPYFTSCPEDTLVGCGQDLDNLIRFGFPSAYDNCNYEIKEEVVRSLNECGLGEVRREFIVSDDYGNSVSKVQIIKISNEDYFNEDRIDWPDDLYLDDGCINSIEPDDLPAGYDKPDVNGNDCTNFAIDYKDEEFIYVEGACRKIIRKWTVLDWCQFNAFDHSIGRYDHYQVIKISNATPPDITVGCNDTPEYEMVDDCKSYVTLVAEAEDDCTPSLDLKWRYYLDIGNDGSVNRDGYGNDASGIMPIGTHKIIWEAEDECGNLATCMNTFTIEDNKAPTPICLTDIVTVLMDGSGSIDIWASDFDKGSVDNCSQISDLDFSFSPNRNDNVMIYTCAMLDGKERDTFEIKMHVIDPKGNFDYCTTTIIIQDNGVCSTGEPEALLTISGAIYDASDDMLSGVEMTLNSDQPEFGTRKLMSDNGAYAFDDLTMYLNYQVAASKEDDPLSGVNTLDLVKIQRHILGLTPFSSPHQLMAADINNSGNVTASDIIQLRKLILGIYDDFPNNKVWRFIPVSETSYTDPLFWAEIQEYNKLDNNVLHNDFLGIKTGDVDASRKDNSKETTFRSVRTITYLKKYIEEEEVFTFYADEGMEGLQGFQLALSYDAARMKFSGIESDVLSLNEQHIHVVEQEEGVIRISWNDETKNSVVGELFTLRFISQYKDFRNVLYLNKSTLKPEVYLSEGIKLHTDALAIEAKSSPLEDGFKVMQNVPNPFDRVTRIGFSIDRAEEVMVTVFDLTGKQLFRQGKKYTAGYHEVTLNQEDLGISGLLYYQVEAGNVTITKRMIAIE